MRIREILNAVLKNPVIYVYRATGLLCGCDSVVPVCHRSYETNLSANIAQMR